MHIKMHCRRCNINITIVVIWLGLYSTLFQHVSNTYYTIYYKLHAFLLYISSPKTERCCRCNAASKPQFAAKRAENHRVNASRIAYPSSQWSAELSWDARFTFCSSVVWTTKKNHTIFRNSRQWKENQYSRDAHHRQYPKKTMNKTTHITITTIPHNKTIMRSRFIIIVHV